MSNDYYERQASLPEFTTARADDVRDEFDGVQSAFEKLPKPRQDGTKGFLTPFTIVDPTLDDHPAKNSQVKNENTKNGQQDTRLDAIEAILTGLGSVEERYTTLRYVATEGQTEIVLPLQFQSLAYVHKNGERLFQTVDFDYESSTKTITFYQALTAGDIILVDVGLVPDSVLVDLLALQDDVTSKHSDVDAWHSEVDGWQQQVSQEKDITLSASIAAQADANYEGDFISGVTNAVKGKSYSFNGETWRCLANTTDDPDINSSSWRKAVSVDDLKKSESRGLDFGVDLYTGTNNEYVRVGDEIPEFSNYLRIPLNGIVESVSMNPPVYGEVAQLTETSLTTVNGDKSVLIKHAGKRIKVYDILFAYGQSNCLGKPSLSGDTSGFPDTTKGAGLYWDVQTQTLIPMVQSIKSWAQDSDSTSSGYAWAEFSNEWYKQTGRGIILVMGASGGKRVEHLSKGYGLNLYENAITGMTTLDVYLASHAEISIGERFCIWHQGESDQSNGTSWSTYYSLLDSLFNDLKSDVSITNFGICVVGNPINRLERQWWGIKNAQRYLSTQRSDTFIAFEGCGNFNTGDGTIGSEGVHYTQKGLNIMGRYAAKSAASAIIGQNTGVDDSYSNKANTQISTDYGIPSAKINAIVTYDGGTSSWIIRSKDTADTSNRFRSINISSLEALSDRFRFWISGHQSNFLNFRAGTTNSNDANQDINTISKFGISGNDTFIDVFLNTDITIGVRTDTGDIRNNVPLASASSASLQKKICSAVTDGLVTTLTHNIIKEHPQATFVPNVSLTDLDFVVRCYAVSSTTTKVSVTKADGTVTGMSSIQAAVLFKNMSLNPSDLIDIAGFQLNLTGEYLL